MASPWDGYADVVQPASARPAPTQASPDNPWGDYAEVVKPAPSKGNLIDRTYNRLTSAIQGKQDPAYADVPPMYKTAMPLGVAAADTGAVLLGSNNAARADIIAKALGNRLTNRIKDANGYDILEYKDDDGTTKRIYPSKPGFDMEDIPRGIMGIIPYLAGGIVGGAATKGMGLTARATVQSGVQGSINVAEQNAQRGMGRTEAVDPREVGLQMIGGAAGEALPARMMGQVIGGVGGAAVAGSDPESDATDVALGTFAGAVAGKHAVNAIRSGAGMKASQYAANGQFTPAGAEAATRAGLNPAEMTADAIDRFSREFALTRDGTKAALAVQQENSIPLSLAERTKDPTQAVREDQMAMGIKGPWARGEIERFKGVPGTSNIGEQGRAIEAALYGRPNPDGMAPAGAPPLGPQSGQPPAGWPKGTQSWAQPAPPPPGPAGSTPPQPGIGGTLAPGRFDARNVGPADLGQSIREGLQSAQQGASQTEEKLWQSARGLTATDESKAILPQMLNEHVGRVGIPIDENTPQAVAMVKRISAFMEGAAPAESAAPWLKNPTGTSNVDQFRRTLLRHTQDAATNTDREAAGAIYNAYNEWIGEAAKRNLLAGDPAAAAKLVEARGFTREMKQLFEPKVNGTQTAAGNRIGKILKGADSPEGVVDALFGNVSSKSSAGQGSLEALKNIKQILGKYADQPTAKQTWDDIRLARWNKLVLDKKGDIATPTVVAANIRQAMQTQRSLMQTLYSAQELGQMKRVATTLEKIGWRPVMKTNPSGSAMAGAVMVKDMFNEMWSKFGLAGRVLGTGVGIATKPVRNQWNLSGAKQATTQAAPTKEVVPSLGAYGAALASAASRLPPDQKKQQRRGMFGG